MRAKVFIREEQQNKMVNITSQSKPDITAAVISKWQKVIDIIAEIINMPAGLIMKINADNIEVFLSSASEDNPYKPGDKEVLGHGLYCESVIGRNSELMVPDARVDDVWKDNPDIKLGMVAYYGLPINWPDDEIFGTICFLDKSAFNNDESYMKLMNTFKEAIEADLALLLEKDKLKQMASIDYLTGIKNRRAIMEILEREYDRYLRTDQKFSVIMIDLDNFKQINDTRGHQEGDRMLVEFVELVSSNIRSIDSLGRFGGDEFLMVCPETAIDGASNLANKLDYIITSSDLVDGIHFRASFGLAEVQRGDTRTDDIIKRADDDLYQNKGKNKHSK